MSWGDKYGDLVVVLVILALVVGGAAWFIVGEVIPSSQQDDMKNHSACVSFSGPTNGANDSSVNCSKYATYTPVPNGYVCVNGIPDNIHQDQWKCTMWAKPTPYGGK